MHSGSTVLGSGAEGDLFRESLDSMRGIGKPSVDHEVLMVPTREESLISMVEHSDEEDDMKGALITLLKSTSVTHTYLDETLGQMKDRVLASQIKTYIAIEKVLSRQAYENEMKALALRGHAVNDEVTGLLTRKALNFAISSEMARAKRFNKKDLREGAEAEPPKELYALMFDIDFFKKVNDSFGHEQANEVLKYLADCLKSVFRRKNDIVARYGGEEFIAIAWCQNSSDAVALAEKVRIMFSSKIFEFENAKTGKLQKFFPTVSAGVSGFSSGMSESDFISSADGALYQAKDSGRNKVVFNKN